MQRRMDDMAQLVANGVGVIQAGERLGMTKGQAARCWANVRAGLGAQAI